MRDTVVLTVIGPDRTGLVETLAARISAAGGNWEASNLATLGGQFAGIVLVTVETHALNSLLKELRSLDSDGLQVIARATDAVPSPPGIAVDLVVTGSDRPGMLRDVASALSIHGINFDKLESRIESAPMSGELLAVCRAQLRVPTHVPLGDVRHSLEALAHEMMVDLIVPDN